MPEESLDVTIFLVPSQCTSYTQLMHVIPITTCMMINDSYTSILPVGYSKGRFWNRVDLINTN